MLLAAWIAWTVSFVLMKTRPTNLRDFDLRGVRRIRRKVIKRNARQLVPGKPGQLQHQRLGCSGVLDGLAPLLCVQGLAFDRESDLAVIINPPRLLVRLEAQQPL